MTGILQVAVIGMGYLGKLHASKIANMREASLYAVIDCNLPRAQSGAQEFGCLSYLDYRDCDVSQLDAVVIASDTSSHFEIAQFFLEHGLHCFIEKPMTTTLQEADKLLAIATQQQVLIQVGHVERFNPCFLAMQSIIVNPLFIEAHRIAPFNARSSNVSVVLDLMIHDIDLVLSLIPSEVKFVQASGASVYTDKIDIANARIQFENAAVANVTASRLSTKKERRFKIFQAASYINLDLQERRYVHYKKDDTVTNELGLTGLREQRDHFPNADPMNAELLAFIDAILDRSICVVDGLAGRRALAVSIRVRDEIFRTMSAVDNELISDSGIEG